MRGGEEMKSFISGMMCFIMLSALGLTLVSCSRDKASDKGTQKLSPEQVRDMKAYQKSVEEAKKTIVATINGVPVLMSDLINEMNTIGPQYRKPGQERDPKVDEKVKKDAMDRLIYRELAVQEAKRQGMGVPPAAVADELKKIRADLKSEDGYKGFLTKSGITEDELKRQLERGILIDMITEKEIFTKVAMDPGEAEKIYAKKKKSFKGPSGQMSFEEARPLIEKELMTAAVQKREDEWVKELKKAAKIEITLGESEKKIHSIK
jgi:hypothetical protein